MTLTQPQPRPFAQTNASALTFHRLESPSQPEPLGGRWTGRHALALRAPLLAAPGGAVFDGWFGGQAHPERRQGCVRWASDGHWLHGCAEIDAGDIQSAARQAYADIFTLLSAQACPHLLRIWNYFPGMNLEVAGVERYRQFNAGRQQAFIDAGRSAFEGSPAACALGTVDGPLLVYFLAHAQPPVAIENPRQVSAYRYPDTYGPRAPTFSRAALADAGGGRQVLFISGTASIVGHATIHLGDVLRQTEESINNMTVVREAAAARAQAGFAARDMHHTIYLRHAQDLGAVREAFERHVGADSPAARGAVYLQADICRADLLVEIEAHGFTRAGAAG